MAEEILLNIVGDVLAKLGSSAIQRIGSAFGVAEEIGKLGGKLDIIYGVLVDAERKQEKSHAVKAWVRRLKDVVYDADDLLDDFEALQLQKHGGVARQVSDFFSSSNQLVFRFKMSDRVKNIKEAIDEIMKQIPLLELSKGQITDRVVESSWRETHSYVLTSEIVGREEKKEEIIKSLISLDNEEILSMVSIVGIGGLGKTTLAQLIYNDPRVVESFELKRWVCVSDPFEVKSLVRKILGQHVESLELNGLKDLLHENISQKKCLLVLDDVWNENYEKWDQLRSLLMVVGKGSKILVTTRHGKVASVMGIDSPFVLEGLKVSESWDLFAKIVFTKEPEKVHPKFVEIGKEIVNMCNGVPLIITTLGTMLRLKMEESYWLSIKNNDNLLSLRDGSTDNVLSVLKLSYDNLSFPLKRCFGYCALFPKDYEIEKKLLVQLWMAQGYVQPLDGRIGDQYIDELLARSLLEVCEKDGDSNRLSCKMHDLIHDLARLVTGLNVLILEDDKKEISKEVHHVSLFYPMNLRLKALNNVKHMRTFLSLEIRHNSEDASIPSFSSFKCLRVLSLNEFNIKKLPKSLGKLIHLRYLDLSNNTFEVLPNSITRLKNLQTLKLVRCGNLKEFPEDTRELINLRYLENNWCRELSHMPCGIGELTLLQSLPIFVVGNGRGVGRLSELKSLNNLRGELSIVNLENVSDAMVDPKEANLWGKQYIQSLELTWGPSEGQSGENGELVMEGLQPHSNLKQLCVNNYGGGRFPSWMMNGGLSSMLPNLTTVDLRACSRCQTLPCFVQLPHLRSLKLYGLEMVEHMEECSLEGPFFQSLQELSLLDMTKLKELWRLSMELPAQPPSSFPCLTQLMIASCGDLAYLELPPSPFLSLLTIQFCDKLGSLELHSSPLLSKLYISGCPKLTFLLLPPSPHLSRLEMDCCDELGSFQLHSSPLLSEVKISFFPKLTSLQRSPSPCFSQSDSYKCDDLASLEVSSFPCLKTLELAEVGEEVLRQLMPSTTASSLESISISSIDELMYLLDELHQHGSTLETLTIEGCSRLAMLPNWIGNLTSLTLLKIGYCPQLTSLPDEMCSLTTLETLLVFDCPYLSERCQREEGEDWPKIAHLPLIFIDGERV